MTPADSDRIAREGATAFGRSLQGRGYPPRDPDRFYRPGEAGRVERGRVYHAYGGWRATPIPPDWTEGTWWAMHCSGSRRIGDFTRAAEMEGSWYATSNAGWILVLPKLNRVLFSYED